MEIVENLIRSKEPTSTALGFFDGVHSGHVSVIREAVSYAQQNGLLPAVFTTKQLPRSVLSGTKVGAITTLDEKLAAFRSLGAERVYIIDFREIMHMTAEDFVKDILLGCFHARHAVCGFNYHFGYGGKGSGSTLSELCRQYDITVTTQHRISYDDSPVSSTRIRSAVASGHFPDVNRMLGRRYGFRLPVLHGKKLGRTIGIPTINQAFPDGLILPPFGAYATAVTVDGTVYCGVTDIGVKPTVGSDHVLIETWLPRYSGRELYGETIDVRFLDFIRPEKKFDGLLSLQEEIRRNALMAQTIFDRCQQ